MKIIDAVKCCVNLSEFWRERGEDEKYEQMWQMGSDIMENYKD